MKIRSLVGRLKAKFVHADAIVRTTQPVDSGSQAPNNKALPAIRTVYRLAVDQSVEWPNLLLIKLTVAQDLLVSTLWTQTRDGWLALGEFSESHTRLELDGRASYELALDLHTIADLLNGSSERSGCDKSRNGNDNDAFRYHLYFQAYSNARKPPNAAKELTQSGSEITFRFPVGRAARIDPVSFDTILHGEHNVTPYINKTGFLSIAIGHKPKPSIRIVNDFMRIGEGKLFIRGSVHIRYAALTNASLVVLGRTSGFKSGTPALLKFDKTESSKRSGELHYNFAAVYDFEDDVQQITDDFADLYLDCHIRNDGEIVRKRIGQSRYMVRRSPGRTIKVVGEKTLFVSPYYTYKAKNPSLRLDVFTAESRDYLQKTLHKRYIRRRRPPRPIWIIGEMPNKAQESGVEFFKYMRNSHPEVDAYYVIDQDSPDRRNLTGYDHVLNTRSVAHIKKMLQADRIIGTHQPTSLYPTQYVPFTRALKAQNVFLQHGVVAAKWILDYAGKASKALSADLVIVSSNRERDFFVHDLGYRPREVAITGLARFDSLFENNVDVKIRQLLIMPTWRPWLQDPERFTQSDYFEHWTSLLANDDFRLSVSKNRLDVVFSLHPNMQQYTELFRGLGARVIMQGEINVQHLLKESGMMLTDYSSVAFDFSFLHKPVIFYQFDAHRFAQPHADPSTELPGPVVRTADAVVQSLDEICANSGAMSKEYVRRANRFIAHRDQANCERIYSAIAGMHNHGHLLDSILRSDLYQVGARLIRQHRWYLPVIRRIYRLFRLLPMQDDIIVFESNLARRFGDSPKAIHDELVRRGDIRKRVVVSNTPTRIRDDGTVTVRRNSLLYFWYLARAKYWINNQSFPWYIERRRHGVFIQTWHGTPLKRMFLDQDQFYGRDPGYKDRVTKASAQWNVLVSPNSHTTNALRSSYGYRGPAYEIGYPRNDILRSDRALAIGQGVRDRFGIAKDSYVVLYAPTFRDDQPTTPGRFKFEWPFDPESFARSVGDDVVLLVRTHMLVTTKVEIPKSVANSVIDVSKEAGIEELFLASDMLVTDYSSSFFDFAVLRRPIVFYAYDLENYEDNLRGFYLNYETDLPGPIVRDSSELFAAILDRKAKTDYAEAVPSEFVERYAPHEDGQAAARVVERLL